MAAKPAAKAAPKKTPSTAVAKAKIPLPANYEEQVQTDMAAFKNRMSVNAVTSIKNQQDKTFLIPSADGAEDVECKTFVGIIVDFCAHKAWYEFDYVAGEQVPPNCFALGFVTHNSLMPSDNSPDIQADACAGCDKNQFVQQANGKWSPKECGDRWVLAVLDSEGRMLKASISSTGIKPFEEYVKKLAAQGQAPYHVLTEFSFADDSKYPSVRCTKFDTVPKDGLGLVLSMREQAIAMVSQEPILDAFEEKVVAKRAPPPKAARGGARKAA